MKKKINQSLINIKKVDQNFFYPICRYTKNSLCNKTYQNIKLSWRIITKLYVVTLPMAIIRFFWYMFHILDQRQEFLFLQYRIYYSLLLIVLEILSIIYAGNDKIRGSANMVRFRKCVEDFHQERMLLH